MELTGSFHISVSTLLKAHLSVTRAKSAGTARSNRKQNTGKENQWGDSWEYRGGQDTVLSVTQQLGFLERIVSTSNFAL